MDTESMERNWMSRHLDAVSTAMAGVGGGLTVTLKQQGVFEAMGALGDLGAFLGGCAAFGALIMGVFQYANKDSDNE
jgi:hypothetical protein